MAKPITIDEEIINKMIERFKKIKEGEEYYYTYSPNVFENRHFSSLKEEEKPAVNIREVKEELINEMEANSKLHECSLIIDIDLILSNTTPRNIREMKADILKSIAADLTWDDFAISTQYISSFRNFRNEHGVVISDYTIRIKIIYRKNAWGIN